MESGVIGLDTDGAILQEYAGYMNFAGRPGVGDEFYRWAHDSQWDAGLCKRVRITPSDDPNRGYDEIPDDPRLEGFDLSDRKFVATAVACGANFAVAVAVDTDWLEFRAPLESAEVAIDYLCLDYLQDVFARRSARQS
jgi:hypothetical protein